MAESVAIKEIIEQFQFALEQFLHTLKKLGKEGIRNAQRQRKLLAIQR